MWLLKTSVGVVAGSALAYWAGVQPWPVWFFMLVGGVAGAAVTQALTGHVESRETEGEPAP